MIYMERDILLCSYRTAFFALYMHLHSKIVVKCLPTRCNQKELYGIAPSISTIFILLRPKTANKHFIEKPCQKKIEVFERKINSQHKWQAAHTSGIVTNVNWLLVSFRTRKITLFFFHKWIWELISQFPLDS